MNARHRLRLGASLLALPLFGALLAACGSSASAGASASASATPTCPPAANTFKNVTGMITSVSGGSITVTDSAGTATAIELGSSVRITRVAAATPADLPAGTAVLVLTDTNATTAKSIRILSGGANGTPGAGGGGFGFGGRARGTPGASGTPGAGVNSACFRRQGQGSGQGQGQGQFPGQGSGFQGLTGSVDSASSSKLTFDDAQGQTYSVSITSATVIQKAATAQASDLKAGMKVMVAAQDASGKLTARTITIQS